MPVRLVPLAVGRTAGAVSGLAESGLMLRLTRGRLWIGALATLLVGIVALNVLALSFNASSSKAGRQTDVLQRRISALHAQVAAAGISNERVQELAGSLGMIVPEPGSIGYLTVHANDAAIAAKRLQSGELSAGSPAETVPATSLASIDVAVPVAPPASPTVTEAPPVDTTTAPAPAAEPAPVPLTDVAVAPESTTETASPPPSTPPAGGGTATGGVSP